MAAPHLSIALLALLALLATPVAPQATVSWEEERLQWLVVTPPDATKIQLNCTSHHIYPFRLLNDSSIIGALGSPVHSVGWLLPDGRLVNASFNDGNRRCVDRGVSLLVEKVTDDTHGLYHCVAVANILNGTHLDMWNTTVYYYKRGLNLYGADLHGGSAWEKYKRNTLIGSLTAGAFLLVVLGYALLDRFGIFSRCSSTRSGNVVEVAAEDASATSPTGAQNGGFAADDEATTDAKTSPPPVSSTSPTAHSMASLRSRRSEKSQQQEGDTSAAAAAGGEAETVT